MKETYYILYGEGEIGTWTGPISTTARGIKHRATRLRSKGDRWARIFVVVDGTYLSDDVGNLRDIPKQD